MFFMDGCTVVLYKLRKYLVIGKSVSPIKV